MATEEYYNLIHSQQLDPWNYGQRGAEILRYEIILQTIQKFCPGSRSRMLDIGCNTGRLAESLAKLPRQVWAVDLSAVAIQKIKEKYQGNPPFAAMRAPSTAIPLEDGFFDAVILSDGIAEWKLNEDELKQTFKEVHRLLSADGIAIFTDYLSGERFEGWIETISNGPFQILEARYLNDRLWYQFESWFKGIRSWSFVRKFIASRNLAKLFQTPSGLFGKYGSKHLMIVAKRAR